MGIGYTIKCCSCNLQEHVSFGDGFFSSYKVFFSNSREEIRHVGKYRNGDSPKEKGLENLKKFLKKDSYLESDKKDIKEILSLVDSIASSKIDTEEALLANGYVEIKEDELNSVVHKIRCKKCGKLGFTMTDDYIDWD